jgi:glutathione S-transferase
VAGGWVGLGQARALPGLRLVLLRGVPSPWSLAASAIFELAGVPFTRVCRMPADPPGLLLEWTRQEGCPAAMYGDERPRTGWAEILQLADRLRAQPSLIPEPSRERALMFGLAHELLGEMGLVWCRRLLGLAPRLREAATDPEVARFAYKYGSSPREMESARERVVEVLRLLAEQLRLQREAGSAFLVGSRLSALDVYWAACSNMIALLPQDQLPLDDEVRRGFSTHDRALLDALDPALLAHRDAIYQRYLHLPVEL